MGSSRLNSLLWGLVLGKRLVGGRNVGFLAMAGALGIVVGGAGNLASKLLKSLALGLGNEKGGEDTAQHEEGEDLHDVVEPRRRIGGGWVTLGSERSEDSLSNNGADLARGGRQTVGGGSVTCREAFSRNNEGGGVGAKIEEKLSQDIQGQETALIQVVVGETNDNEDDGEEDEAHQLNWLTADGIDSGNGDPVTWDGASADDDQVADSSVVQHFPHGVTFGVADGLENDGVIETETVESNIFGSVSKDAKTNFAQL